MAKPVARAQMLIERAALAITKARNDNIAAHGVLRPGMALDDRLLARAAITALADRSGWPMDEIGDKLDEFGVNSPRPSDVLAAYFSVALK